MTNMRDLFKHILSKQFIILTLMVVSLAGLTGCSSPTMATIEEVAEEEKETENQPQTAKDLTKELENNLENELENNLENGRDQEDVVQSDSFEGYRLIEVDGGNQSGHREANVVVNIGFGDREYYGFTNQYGQLVKVTAKEIILQDDQNEPVLASGRYYPDEAKVPGVESPNLDEGHVIADSLGGVSNAYNITPQNSTLNRHGDQAYMEKTIRSAGGCTDFTAIITYPNTTTHIPSHYSYTYAINGNEIHDAFDNVNPDEVNEEMGLTAPIEKEKVTALSIGIEITKLDKKAEYIIMKNSNPNPVDLTGWKILSVQGNQSFIFPAFNLEANATVKVGDSQKNPDVDFHWLDGNGTWNNSKSDPAELYNQAGELVDQYND